MDGVTLSAIIFGAASLLAFIIEGNSKAIETVEKIRKKNLTVSPIIVSQLSNHDQRSAKVSLHLVEPILTNWIKKNVLSATIKFKSIVVPTALMFAVLIGISYVLKDKASWGSDVVDFLQIFLYIFGSAAVILVAIIKRLVAVWG
ncbi:MAG: hypothetical protein AB2604_02920 [Candidatus Thiodiazotropha taylori]